MHTPMGNQKIIENETAYEHTSHASSILNLMPLMSASARGMNERGRGRGRQSAGMQRISGGLRQHEEITKQFRAADGSSVGEMVGGVHEEMAKQFRERIRVYVYQLMRR